MGILKQIEAKKKIEKVIDSCTTDIHVKYTNNFIKLYYYMFEDYNGFHHLKRLLENKTLK
tara:strand:+ start:637 stop:816 length:180 start_codon:yes stop_codon:yes gene_type:complete